MSLKLVQRALAQGKVDVEVEMAGPVDVLGTLTCEFTMGVWVKGWVQEELARGQVAAVVWEVRMIRGQEVGRCGRRVVSSGVAPEKVIKRMRSFCEMELLS